MPKTQLSEDLSWNYFSVVVAHELEQLFVKQSSLETYFEWLDSVIEKRICEVCIAWSVHVTQS